ncbi:hypothetical protein [Streptomyces sp. NRRL S-1022]|uniref:hypothetical protein n=1 Tax=Streptomyces sp. NRRL S-1022 TaxID=1463880 RepID=UPI000A645D57|nr:hypothetical protein [Streptomyces sp. NRRL S-1022]
MRVVAGQGVGHLGALWSLHQQSRSSGMHRPGTELGSAVPRLMPAAVADRLEQRG